MSLLKRWYPQCYGKSNSCHHSFTSLDLNWSNQTPAYAKIIWLISASREKYKLWSEKILIGYCDVWVLIPKHLPTAKSSFHLNKSSKIHSDWTAEKTISLKKIDIFIFSSFFPPQETVFTSLQAFWRVTSRSNTGEWLGRHAGGRRGKVSLLSK